MRRLSVFLLMLTFFATSCSEEEPGNDQNLENANLSLADESQIVDAPQGLKDSDDTYAVLVDSWIQTANGMTQYLTYFDIPEGAQKTTNPIVPANGRMAATTEEYLVYKWEHGGYGVAYQVSQDVENYYFEVFIKLQDDPNWYKYVHAEENKAHTIGSFIVYDAFDKKSEDLWQYNWDKTSEDFKFEVSSSLSNYSYEMVINKETKAGTVTYYNDGQIDYNISWDAQGNGSWKNYDDEGKLDSQGEWFA